MTRISGTQDAFYELIMIRGSYKALNVERSTIHTWKKLIHEQQRWPSDKTMRKLLLTAGAKIVKEEIVWSIPDII